MCTHCALTVSTDGGNKQQATSDSAHADPAQIDNLLKVSLELCCFQRFKIVNLCRGVSKGLHDFEKSFELVLHKGKESFKAQLS